MTEAQLRRLAKRWAPRLGLDGWQIHVQIGGLEDAENYAETHTSSDYRRATIRFGRTAADHPAGLEVLVVHELLHVATRDIRNTGLFGLEDEVHPAAQRVHDRAFRHLLEQEVDRLAVALVATWPS